MGGQPDPLKYSNDNSNVDSPIVLSDSPISSPNVSRSTMQEGTPTTSGNASNIGEASDESEDDIISSRDRVWRFQKPADRTNIVSTDPNIHRSDTNQFSPAPISTTRRQFKQLLREIESQDIIEKIYPRSLHPNSFPLQPKNEKEILSSFVNAYRRKPKDKRQYLELSLFNFSVYRAVDDKKGEGLLEGLNVVCTNTSNYCFEGWISVEGKMLYVESIFIEEISIGGLDEPETHTTSGLVWIKSKEAAKYNDAVTVPGDGIWYKLETPAPEYEDLWSTSFWLTNLVKHVADYLFAAQKAANSGVELADFQSRFVQWLDEMHGTSPEYHEWRAQCGNRKDLRQDIATYSQLLYNKIFYLEECQNHPLWEQVHPLASENQEKDSEQTIATRNIGEPFLVAFPHWGKAGETRGLDILNIVDPCPEVAAQQQKNKAEMSLPDKFKVSQLNNFEFREGQRLSLASLTLEEAAECPKSKLAAEQLRGRLIVLETQRRDCVLEYSYAFVRRCDSRKKMIQVIWVVLPSQTTCGHAHYPVGNELFLSDRCNCDFYPLSKVVCAFKVTMFSDHAQEGDQFFINEKYEEKNKSFISANENDLEYQCRCQEPNPKPLVDKINTTIRRKEAEVTRKMRAFSLFSGCGLLDMGMESSGVCETILAIDVDRFAIKSHAINHTHTNSGCVYVNGSVNDLLQRYISGEIPLEECVDAVIAGCCCQGFTPRNPDRYSKGAQINCSLATTALSFVDLYSPAFLLIENVPEIDKFEAGGPGTPTVCQQIICAMVAMGYQIKKGLYLSSDYGDAQNRKRLFIFATAPGFEIPKPPKRTHGSDLIPMVTASKATESLGSVDNDITSNVRNPLHVPVYRLDRHSGLDGQTDISLRSVVSKIPNQPRESNLYTAWKDGHLNDLEAEWAEQWLNAEKNEKMKSTAGTLRRIDPNKPFRTVLTQISALDARSAPMIHWAEDRMATVAELWAAMGKPVNMVFIGPMKAQMKMAGNGVPLQLASAVGREMGDAWLASIAKTTSTVARSSASVARVTSTTIFSVPKTPSGKSLIGKTLQDDQTTASAAQKQSLKSLFGQTLAAPFHFSLAPPALVPRPSRSSTTEIIEVLSSAEEEEEEKKKKKKKKKKHPPRKKLKTSAKNKEEKEASVAEVGYFEENEDGVFVFQS